MPTDAGQDAEVPSVDAGTPFEPTAFCPGAPGCESGEGELRAGAAAVTITPIIDDTTDIMTVDVDGDGEFEPSQGDEFEDRDGVPGFQGTWIAGFGNARPASGVHDDTWARAVALESGDVRLVIVSLDLVGWFKPDMDLIRQMVADLEIDHVLFSSTHTHQGRDTVGIWGIREDISGLDLDYNAFVRERAAEAIRTAVGALRPAHIQYVDLDLRDQGAITRWLGDLRDPIVIDPEVRVMRLLEAETSETISTIVNFGTHPEYVDDRNTLISSDLAHFVREGIESGVAGPDGDVAGLGGVAVYLQGACGSQIGPNGLDVETWEGEAVEQDDDVWRFTETVGSQIAYFVLEALGPDGGSVTQESAALGFRTREFFVDVQNRGFHVAISQGLFDRVGFNWDPEQIIVPGENEPDLRVEVTALDVGDARLITAPGELDPTLFIGGYDGSYTPDGVPIVDPDNEAPPALDQAPSPPYLRELAGGSERRVWLVGLANDYLGYLIPEFDYVLSPSAPYFDQAPGDHYEETVSVGIDGWPTIRRELEALLAWSPDGA